MKEFEKIMRDFFENENLIGDKVFFGKTLTGRLNETTNVKISFETLMVADNYYGFQIKIINKVNGPVDTVFIEFGDVTGKIQTLDGEKSLYIWKNGNKVDWYCVRPTTLQIKEIVKRVDDYLKLYI